MKLSKQTTLRDKKEEIKIFEIKNWKQYTVAKKKDQLMTCSSHWEVSIKYFKLLPWKRMTYKSSNEQNLRRRKRKKMYSIHISIKLNNLPKLLCRRCEWKLAAVPQNWISTEIYVEKKSLQLDLCVRVTVVLEWYIDYQAQTSKFTNTFTSS